MNQLKGTKGLLGYSVFARPLAKSFWTLSLWEDEAALSTFVQALPHARTMMLMASHIGETSFIRWRVKGSEIPPSWDDASTHWARS